MFKKSFLLIVIFFQFLASCSDFSEENLIEQSGAPLLKGLGTHTCLLYTSDAADE